MSTSNRIRYIDYDYRPGCKISLRKFTSSKNGASYRVIINEEEMEYYVRNERSKEFVKKSRKHKNMNILKKEAREDLESLGVEFKRESRNRTFGLKPKGYSQKDHEREERQKKVDNDSN